MAFASGNKAYGISDRSGFRYRLKDMKKEWTGALVGPDEFEPKHPQLLPIRIGSDPQALRNPRPEPNLPEERSIQYGFNPVGFNSIPGITPANNLAPVGEIGTVVVTGVINPVEEVDTAYPTLVAATMSVGTVSVTVPVESDTVYPTGVPATASVGSVSGIGADDIAYVSGLAATASVGAVSITTTSDIAETYTVTVAAYLGANYFYIDGTRAATLNLSEGSIYRFDQADSSNSNHPLRFSTTSNGTHGGGSEYTTGVTTNGTPGNAGAYTQIEVASGAPTLYYYCTNHSGMGGQINT